MTELPDELWVYGILQYLDPCEIEPVVQDTHLKGDRSILALYEVDDLIRYGYIDEMMDRLDTIDLNVYYPLVHKYKFFQRVPIPKFICPGDPAILKKHGMKAMRRITKPRDISDCCCVHHHHERCVFIFMLSYCTPEQLEIFANRFNVNLSDVLDSQWSMEITYFLTRAWKRENYDAVKWAVDELAVDTALNLSIFYTHTVFSSLSEGFTDLAEYVIDHYLVSYKDLNSMFGEYDQDHNVLRDIICYCPYKSTVWFMEYFNITLDTIIESTFEWLDDFIGDNGDRETMIYLAQQLSLTMEVVKLNMDSDDFQDNKEYLEKYLPE